MHKTTGVDAPHPNGFAFRSCMGFSQKDDPQPYVIATAPNSQQPSLPKIPSMVFDLELGDEDAKIGTQVDSPTAATVFALKKLLEPQNSGEAKLMETVKEICASAAWQWGEERLGVLAHLLECRGYSVGIRKAVGGGQGGDCLKNLRHRFLRCKIPGSNKIFIVDPTFKDQFSIVHSTDQYNAVLAEVPSPTVFAEIRVVQLVQLLSQELSLAFKTHGVVLPPWRKLSSILTKWIPRQSLDQPVSRASMVERRESTVDDLNLATNKSWNSGYPEGKDYSSKMCRRLRRPSWDFVSQF